MGAFDAARLRHTHTAEEVVLILAGEAEAEVNGETASATTGTVILVPAHTPHGLANSGRDTLRVVDFFASAAMVSTYEAPIAPLGTDVRVTPYPEAAIAATGMRT